MFCEDDPVGTKLTLHYDASKTQRINYSANSVQKPLQNVHNVQCSYLCSDTLANGDGTHQHSPVCLSSLGQIKS